MSGLSSNEGLWIAFTGSLLASLVGSAHCAGMCGGLVGVGRGTDTERGGAWALQASRVFTYAILGVGAGVVGKQLFALGVLAWLHRFALILWAGFVVWMALRIARGEGLLPPALAQGVFRFSRRWGHARPWILGVGMAFLPCAWLHGFLMTAAMTGSPTLGGITMAGLGLGTLPALAGISMLARYRPRFSPRTVAVLWVAFGMMSLGLQSGWIAMPGHSHGAHSSTSHSQGSSELAPPAQSQVHSHSHSHH